MSALASVLGTGYAVRMEQLEIARLGARGDGIAHGAQTDVYVALTLPGERVEVVVEGERALGRARILTPSPDRVKPPCPRFGTCGGCAVQHASDAFVAAWKREIVERALSAHGLTADILSAPPSPPESRRRAVLSGRRTKKGTEIGFHARGEEAIIDASPCVVLTPGLREALPKLGEIIRVAASRKGEVKLAVTDTLEGLDLSVLEAKPADGPMLVELGALAHRLGLARLSWNGDVVATARPPRLMFGKASVLPPPGAFLQATQAGQDTLTALVREAVGTAERIVDLFAGCGTFALPLAEAAEVHAVESDAEMIAALDAGWRRAPGLKRVTSEVRDLFRRPLLPGEFKGIDAVVIDPPRAGAAAQIAEIARARVPVVAAVSCNPASFASDAARLMDAGYRLGPVTVVDQFRWSPHVELFAALTL